MIQRIVVALLLVSGFACTTKRAVGPTLSVPKDTPEVCTQHCDSMGMRLAAVVLIANSEGCVCEPRDASPATPRAGAAAAGITPILAAASAAAVHRQQQEEQRRREGSPKAPWQNPGGPHIGR